VALGRPAIRLDQPICGSFAFRGKSCQIGQNFYRSQLRAVEAVVDGQRARNMTLALYEMSSELVHGRNQYAWMAPKPTLVGVFGQPSGPSLEMARSAKTLRDSFKQGRAWASEPLPAIAAAPPTGAPQIAAPERGTPKPTARADHDYAERRRPHRGQGLCDRAFSRQRSTLDSAAHDTAHGSAAMALGAAEKAA
jgi:hypothetical protein